MIKKIGVFLILASLNFVSCIDEIKFDTEGYKSKIVIDGSISNAPGPYQVLIYTSKPYTAEGETQLTSVDKVNIVEEGGKTTPLREISAGLYETDSSALRGQVGKTYFVKIRTLDGREYQSKPERILPPVPIDDYNIEFSPIVTDPKPFKLSLITKDPIEKGNYYRWKWTHYDTTSICKTIVQKSDQSRTTINTPCCEKCWSFDPCKDCLYVAPDALTNGKTIETVVGYLPYESRKPYFLVIEQFSISKEYFEFWKITQSQINNSGGIFDNAPAQAQGNIINTKDSTDQPLGYFSASGVTQKPVYFIRDRKEYPDRVRTIISNPTIVLNTCIPCGGALRTKRRPVGWKD